MDMLKIKFAPFTIFLTRCLETLAAGLHFSVMMVVIFGNSTTFSLALLLIYYTNYWLIFSLYLIWAFTIDKNTCDHGGRRIEWVRDWAWWKHLKNYFPVRLTKVAEVELSPSRNYMFCSIPHGLMATGYFSAFATNHSEFKDLFPHHTPYLLTIKQNFQGPFSRELIYSIGMCSASKESINWLLGYPKGGKVAILVVGGVAETYYSKPGVYKSVANKRKGFVRMAIQNGSAIVPTISFGETSIFNQMDNPKGSFLRKFQDWYKKLTGVPLIIPLGRGFGMVPLRKPINIVVGKPMDVPKIEDPTPEQINTVHEQFLKQLTELFETEKHKYIENPEVTMLEFAED